MNEKRLSSIGKIIVCIAALALSFVLGMRVGHSLGISHAADELASTSSEDPKQPSESQTTQPTHSQSAENSEKSHSPIRSETSQSSANTEKTDARQSEQESWQTETSEDSWPAEESTSEPALETQLEVYEDGEYSSKEEVALYIHLFGHLPSNYISKTKAKKAGWVPSKGNLDRVCPGKSIGGSEFYNDEGLLPDAAGRTWTECDINYSGGTRNAERIVFSNDGLIFYTDDHYKSFTQLY